jgi:hypothetical protein
VRARASTSTRRCWSARPGVGVDTRATSATATSGSASRSGTCRLLGVVRPNPHDARASAPRASTQATSPATRATSTRGSESLRNIGLITAGYLDEVNVNDASSRRMALGLAWVVLVAGVRRLGGGRRSDSKLARAERSLQAELEEAADHLGLAAEPGEVVSPTRCDAGNASGGHAAAIASACASPGPGAVLAAKRPLLAPARPPGARVSAATGASRPSSRPPIRAGRSGSSSSRTAARPALRRHPVPAGPEVLTPAADTLGRVDERALPSA